MELFNSFKAINSKDVDGIVDFFIKNDYVVDNFTNIVENLDSADDVANLTACYSELVLIMQTIRRLDSGTYIKVHDAFRRKCGKNSLPRLYKLCMMIDNKSKIDYVNEQWEALEKKDPAAFASLERVYNWLAVRFNEYALRNYYSELQCDVVSSWDNGKPSYIHERICDFYFHVVTHDESVDGNLNLIKWALLKLYDGTFFTISLLAHSYAIRQSEVLTLGFKEGYVIEMINSFNGMPITCLLPDLGKGVLQIQGNKYLNFCCPKEAKHGKVSCPDALRPAFEC